MSAPSRCARCGRSSSAELPGLCGTCLLLNALDDSPAADSGADGEWFIERYRVLEEIARGGMGIIYRARQDEPERIVAIKMLAPWLLSQPSMLTRFRNEADAIARLDHSGILPIFEVGEHEGLPFFSMRYAEGGSLADCAADYRGQWLAMASLVARIARAVHHANTRGILHRDLKPSNILFTAEREPLVADFGLARWLDERRGLTLPASVLGSPEYMAPEQLNQAYGDVSPATDVYSLGAVLYELVCGRPPNLQRDVISALRQVTVVEPPAPRSTVPDAPLDLEAIILKCLQKLPSLRYASAAELAEDLERFIARQSVQALHPQRQQRLRSAQVIILTLAAAAGLSALAWWAGGSNDSLPQGQSGQSTASLTIGDVRKPQLALRHVMVFPFGADDRDPASQYAGAAIAEAVRAELTQRGDLEMEWPVAAPTTLIEAGRIGTLEAARKQRVDAFLEGRLVMERKQLMLDARLVGAADGQIIWLGRVMADKTDIGRAAVALAGQIEAELVRRQIQGDDTK